MHEDDMVIDRQADLVAKSLSDSLQLIAGSDLCAVWLYGASVFGHPYVYIDLHVILRRQLSAKAWESVRAAHARLGESAGLPPEDLDFWYITIDDARSHRNPVHMSPWAAGLTDKHWALHRAHWIAGRVNVIFGPKPSSIVSPPEWHDIERALRLELVNPQPSAYWVLQLCRVWASLLTRDVVRSKLDSGRWALEHLPKDYHALIQAAMRYYEHVRNPDDQGFILDGFHSFLRKIRELVE
jgi:hypothetical protein